MTGDDDDDAERWGDNDTGGVCKFNTTTGIPDENCYFLPDPDANVSRFMIIIIITILIIIIHSSYISSITITIIILFNIIIIIHSS